MHIRKAGIDDLNQIMRIYRVAQDFMFESGNPNQWGHFYPSKDLVKEDIAKGISYLICEGDDLTVNLMLSLFLLMVWSRLINILKMGGGLMKSHI